jgi:hypothetical protein
LCIIEERRTLGREAVSVIVKGLSQELKDHPHRQGHMNVRNDVIIQRIITSIFEEEDRDYDYPRA